MNNILSVEEGAGTATMPQGGLGRWRVWVGWIVGVAYVIRLVYAARVELLPEETYYWNYSRHLDIGYLDHPPLVAWLIRLGTSVFGSTELGVRSGALCSGAVAAFFVFRLTRNLFGEASALLALAMMQVLPFFFLAGLLMTPDAPLTAAWAASLYFLERGLVAGRPRAWLWAGLSFGLGMISKYTIALLGLAAGVYMVMDAPSRRWFGRWQPYAAMLLAAALFAPVFVWNAEHDWASFAFQTARRLAEPRRFSVHKLVGSTLVLLTPVGLAAAAAALVDPAPPARARRLLQVAVLLPLSVFAIFSVSHEVKLDWTGAAWTAAVPLMAFGLARANTTNEVGRPCGRPWLRRVWPPTIVVLLAFYAAGAYHLTLGIPGLGYTAHMELVPVGWREFAAQVDGVANSWRAEHRDRLLVIGMDRYAIASELAFYSTDQSRAVADTSSAHLFGDRGLMYEQWFPAGAQAGRTLLLVAWERSALDAPNVEGRFGRLEPMHEGVLLQGGRPLRHYYYRFGLDYR